MYFMTSAGFIGWNVKRTPLRCMSPGMLLLCSTTAILDSDGDVTIPFLSNRHTHIHDISSSPEGYRMCKCNPLS